MKVQVVYGTEIFVSGVKRQPNEIIEVNEKSNEIKNLLANGYIKQNKVIA